MPYTHFNLQAQVGASTGGGCTLPTSAIVYHLMYVWPEAGCVTQLWCLAVLMPVTWLWCLNVLCPSTPVADAMERTSSSWHHGCCLDCCCKQPNAQPASLARWGKL